MPRRARWGVAVVLAVVAALLTPVALVARYARSELLDTDRYVSTVAPLAGDPAVQEAVTDRVTDEIFGRLDIEALISEALESLAARDVPEQVVGLAAPLAGQVESFTRDEVGSFVRSDEFATLWEQANRAAHAQVDALLTGETGGAVDVADGSVTIDLGDVVAAVKQRLVDRGFGPAERIPEVDTELTIVESDTLAEAQRGVRLLDRTANLLPFVILALGAAAVLVAPDRRRGLLVVAAGIALSMVLVAAALALARNWYVDNGAGDEVAKDARLSIAHTLLVPLRTSLRAVLVLGAVVALGAWLAGSSAAARAMRGGATRGLSALRGHAPGGEPPSPVAAWVGRYKTALRAGIAVIGALVFVLWTYPSGAVVLTIAAIVVVALVVVELIGRSPAQSEATTSR